MQLELESQAGVLLSARVLLLPEESEAMEPDVSSSFHRANGARLGAATMMLSACVSDGVPGSVTATVKLLTPVPVGVPEIPTEFDVLDPNESPGGNVPEAMDQA